MNTLRFIRQLIVSIILSVVTLTGNSQIYNPYNSSHTFEVRGVFYRHPTYSGTDTEFKFLGDVTATIEQTSKGFRLIKINGNKVKMDPPPVVDLNNNQNGQVTECTISDNYWYEAHYRKNGISYSVCFNSERIRDYYISH